MPEVTLSVFIKYARYPYTVGNPVLSIVLTLNMLVLFIYMAVSLKNALKEEVTDVTVTKMYAVYGFLAYYGVLLFGTVISKIMTANIFVDRYLLFSHGFLWIFYALSVSTLCRDNEEVKGFYAGKTLFLSCVILEICIGIIGYIKEYKIEYSTNPAALKEYLSENVGEGDVLYTIEDNEEMAFCLPFYEEKLTNYEELNEALNNANSQSKNLFVSVIDYKEGDTESDIRVIINDGFKKMSEDDFVFDRYSIKIYRFSKGK